MNSNNLSVGANTLKWQYTGSDPDDLYSSGDQLFYSALTGTQPAQTDTPSSGGGSSSDPGGFMIAADGIEAKAVEYIENYNERIDAYRKFENNKDALNSARFWADALATSILVENNDASLAEDWNQYYQPLSDQSLSTSLPIRIPDGIPSTAASKHRLFLKWQQSQSNEEENNSLGRELWISNGKNGGNKLL